MRRIALLSLLFLSIACSRNATQVAMTATDDALATGPQTNITATSAAAPQPKPAPTSAKPAAVQPAPAPE